VEPLRESAHGALIKSFIAEGNVNEAVKDFYRFRDLLRAELGVDPSPQLTNLVENLHRRRTDR
jgi:DNA-binding SARP family transcriptional activator